MHGAIAPKGHRNVVIAYGFYALVAYFAWLAGREQITQMGPTFIALGTSTAMIIGARAANKYAETRNGGQAE